MPPRPRRGRRVQATHSNSNSNSNANGPTTSVASGEAPVELSWPNPNHHPASPTYAAIKASQDQRVPNPTSPCRPRCFLRPPSSPRNLHPVSELLPSPPLPAHQPLQFPSPPPSLTRSYLYRLIQNPCRRILSTNPSGVRSGGFPCQPTLLLCLTRLGSRLVGMGTGEGGGRRRRKLEGADGDDSDEEYVLEEEEDEEEVDELEYGRGGRDAASSSAGEEGGGSDAEYEVDDEEEEEETPRPKRPVKRKANPAPARSRRRRYEDDDDYSEELEEDEEDLDGEEEPRRPNCATKCGGRGQKAKMPPVAQRSNRPRHAVEEDMDFDPDLDEGEGDEDTDFDPDLEGDDDEFEDDQEEELGVSHTRTIPRLKNTVRRNSASKQRRVKKKNSNTSRVSKRKIRKPVLGRRRRKRSVIERYEDDDDDFIVENDQVEVNRNSRKKARFARQVEVDRPVPVAEADIWPAIDSDSSEFEFGTSEDEPEGEPVRAAVRKGRKKRGVSGSSSDSEFHVSDKELSDVREEEVKMKKRVRVLQSSSDSEFHLSDKEMSDVREEEVKMKKRVRLLQSSSDSEFHLSDKEMSDVKEEEVERKKRTCVLHSSSESEFHASYKELGDIRIEEARRKKRLLVPQSSSDSEFHVSDKDVRDFGEAKSLVAQPMLSVSPGRLSFTRDGGDKGKEKKELVDAGKPWCGICLSEDQRMTLQGVLNCCSHYFCFACIMEWSKVESRCPLCKRRFNTITKSSKVGLGLELKKSVIKVEERDQVYQPTEEEIRRWLDPYENLVCIECNQGGDDSLMLLCDICDSSAHTYCVGLGREVPEGNWYCGGCRLSGEGSTHPRSLTNSNSAQLGTTAPISTFGRSPSINPWQTFQGFDLNVSPRDIPRQNIHADSRASTLGVSTPTGRLATLSRRRGLMHILLDRQRQLVSQDIGHDGVQHSGYALRADPDHRNFCASSESHSLQHNDSLPRIEPNRRNFSGPWEANSSQTLLDDIWDQHSCFSSVQAQRNSTPCLFVDGNNFQQTESVNSNVKHVQYKSSLEFHSVGGVLDRP